MTRETVPAHIWEDETLAEARRVAGSDALRFVDDVAAERVANGMPRIQFSYLIGESYQDAGRLLGELARGRQIAWRANSWRRNLQNRKIITAEEIAAQRA